MELRDLPAVDKLVESLGPLLPRRITTEIARAALQQAREQILGGKEADPHVLAIEAANRLEAVRPQQVLNATGVLLHTNLGRAPLDPAAAAAAAAAATGYGNVELRLSDGSRGGRGEYVISLLTSLTGAESAMVVNNNAGALYLSLTCLAQNLPVPVARGELIEIGGSYRLPDLMAAAGTRLVEIGTTNRTRIGDYADAVRQETPLLLKVHPSNYRVTGFTDEATLAELVQLGQEESIPVLFDAGSGLLDERVPWLAGPPPDWLVGEPGIHQAVESGAALTMFSGDKLLGGPQAGILVGSSDLINRLKGHPVARAMRVDGPTLAALAATLERYADGTAAELPFWRMAALSFEELNQRCLNLAAGLEVEVIAGTSTVGAGSVPGAEVASPLIAISDHADRRYLQLLRAETPVVARRSHGKLVLDLRAVEPGRDRDLRSALEAVWP